MVRSRLSIVIAIAVALIGAAPAAAAVDATGRSGQVRFVKRMDSSFDSAVTNTTPAQQAWLNQKLWRTEVFAPFFDSRTSWYANGWAYKDIYAVGNGSTFATQHPDWILKDASGNKLYIPWGCGNGWCPQFAGDITNPGFRADWINTLKGMLAKGYRGAWIDDVNLELRVSNANGADVLPYSASLGRTMNAADWRKAMADFTEQIRTAIPDKELLHNSIWYAGQGVGRDADPSVQREIASADYINVERGFNDGGLTGGTGDWSLKALQGFVDRVHAKGKGVIIDGFDSSAAGSEYSLANYLLINTGKDGVGEMSQGPSNWWKGWDTDLGTASADRYDWQGVQRRDFTGGIALVNEPGAPTRTITLPKAMTTIDGRSVTTVTLAGGRGAVLTGGSVVAGAGSVSGGTTGTKPPSTTTGSGTTTGTTGAQTCSTVKITYPALRWDAKKGRFVNVTGRAKVCIDAKLKKGTKAHKAAIRKAKRAARRASVHQAKAARATAARAGAARA